MDLEGAEGESSGEEECRAYKYRRSYTSRASMRAMDVALPTRRMGRFFSRTRIAVLNSPLTLILNRTEADGVCRHLKLPDDGGCPGRSWGKDKHCEGVTAGDGGSRDHR
jgi:hypothetical protein